eukprot:Gregarina_sp_Poly_1__10575@NODE_786_length_6292_cov_38_531406_g575_i0_p3_GENE_NODE_786_length_6292_cov_38_531406_g575_i0NODE_786_length_6292_cov_38_531406_g575_i0_p3_ORF_typecomplete_len245_score25_52EMP24_GP25L/PF01105_24/2_2e20_NODE_786_length_6292_cov_38_531406_g575_i094735
MLAGLLCTALLVSWSKAIRVALLPSEEECIGLRSVAATQVIINYEAFPSDEAKIKVDVEKQMIDLHTSKPLNSWEKSRSVPAWNHGRLNLTSDLYGTHQTVFHICFSNSGKSKVADLAFTIRADDYEHLHDVATKDHTVGLLRSVSQLNQETHKLFEQQHFSLAREESQRNAIERVHRNMVLWSFAQAFALTIFAGGQVMYIRKQFQGPKTLL